MFQGGGARKKWRRGGRSSAFDNIAGGNVRQLENQI
jgi:hypothetical protein